MWKPDAENIRKTIPFLFGCPKKVLESGHVPESRYVRDSFLFHLKDLFSELLRFIFSVGRSEQRNNSMDVLQICCLASVL